MVEVTGQVAEIMIDLAGRGEVRIWYVDAGGGEVLCLAPGDIELSADDARMVERFCRLDLHERRRQWLLRLDDRRLRLARPPRRDTTS